MEHLTLTPDTDFRELFKPSSVYTCCTCCPCCGCSGHCYQMKDDIQIEIERLNFVPTIEFLQGFLDRDIDPDIEQELVPQYVKIVPMMENAQFDQNCDPNDAKVSTINGTLQTEIIPNDPLSIETPDTEKADNLATLLRSGEWRAIYNDANEWALPDVRGFITVANDFAENLRYFAVNGFQQLPFITGARTKAALRERQTDEPTDEPIDDHIHNSWFGKNDGNHFTLASADKSINSPDVGPVDNRVCAASANVISLPHIDLSDLEL